jgi:hypothetical protein
MGNWELGIGNWGFSGCGVQLQPIVPTADKLFLSNTDN